MHMRITGVFAFPADAVGAERTDLEIWKGGRSSAQECGRGGDLPLPFRPQPNRQTDDWIGELLPAGGFAASLAKGG